MNHRLMSITETQTTTAYQQEFVARITRADQQTIDTLKSAFSMFGTLTKGVAPIVVRKLRGETNLEITIATGISKQTVWRRWNNLIIDNPLWAVLRNGNEGLRGGGRKPGGPGGRKKQPQTEDCQ